MESAIYSLHFFFSKHLGRILHGGVWLVAIAAATGCASPYRSDRGAVIGGLGGAGLGAIVGNALGSTGAGAAIGAGVGALSGAAIGGSLDEIEARNRLEIEQRLGRPVAAGGVATTDVVEMTRAGVPEEVIVTHVRTRGMVAPLQAQDLIMLQQQGVSGRVVQAMQAPPATQPGPMGPPMYSGPPVYVEAPPPVFIAPPPYWGPPPRYYRPHHGVSWGVSVAN